MRTGMMVAVLLVLVSGCAKKAAPTKELTERQRDSLIGVSGLPGGTVVTRALATSDSAAARAKSMGQQVQQTGDQPTGGESQGTPP